MKLTNNGVPTDNGQLMDRKEMAEAIANHLRVYPGREVEILENDMVVASDRIFTNVYNPISVMCDTWVYFHVDPAGLVDAAKQLHLLWSSIRILKPPVPGRPTLVMIQVDSLQTATHIANILLPIESKATYLRHKPGTRDQIDISHIITSDLEKQVALEALKSMKHLIPNPDKGYWENFVFAHRLHSMQECRFDNVPNIMEVNNDAE